MVCAGDSITNGLMSANYVSMLQHDLGWSYEVVNAGVNGELAWNLLQRLDDIIACQPDVVTVLIGTNDAAAHVDESWRADYVKRQHLPQPPTLDWYRESLEQIVTRLRNETRATVALLEIPMLGEDLDSVHNQRVDQYNAAIHAVGARAGVPVLDVHERLVAALPDGRRSPRFDGSKRLMGAAFLQRLLFRRTYDEISERHGMALLTDHVHLNERAAAVVADAIGELVAARRQPGSRSTRLPSPHRTATSELVATRPPTSPAQGRSSGSTAAASRADRSTCSRPTPWPGRWPGPGPPS